MDILNLKVGEIIRSGEFHVVTQAKINEFAEATGDNQWIHIDEGRCKLESPFKTTIAHGFLTLSLMPKFFGENISVDANTTTLINYGLDTLRFIEPVRSNDAIRYSFKLVSIEPKTMGDLYKFEGTVEIRDREKPALIGEFLSLVIKNH